VRLDSTTGYAIAHERLARLADIPLRQGKGLGVNGGADVCIMQAADWLAGGDGKTDAPDCVCKALRHYAIGLNDRIDDAELRTTLLRPLVPLLVGTATSDPALMSRRRWSLADGLFRQILPAALDYREKHKPFAAELRALPPITGRDSAVAGKEIVARVRRAAAAATYAAARATAYAADAAHAVADAADAAAAATYAAAHAAAHAAADAAYAAAHADAYVAAHAAAYVAYAAYAARKAKEHIWRLSVENLRRACEVR
jgi:hypothetical protein